MSKRRLLLDYYGCLTEWAHVDGEGNLTIEEIDMTAPYVEAARIFADAPPRGDAWRHAGIVPQHVLAKSLREGWSKADFRRWFNDPDNAYLRTGVERL